LLGKIAGRQTGEMKRSGEQSIWKSFRICTVYQSNQI